VLVVEEEELLLNGIDVGVPFEMSMSRVFSVGLPILSIIPTRPETGEGGGVIKS
jgi:hypothetical protein